VTKVGKSDCEGTFAGASGNDEDAPFPAIRLDESRRRGSTYNGRSTRPDLSICLTLLFEIQ
jgi:hypothetical protein